VTPQLKVVVDAMTKWIQPTTTTTITKTVIYTKTVTETYTTVLTHEVTKTVTATLTETRILYETVTVTATVYARRAIEELVIDRINEYRGREGIPPVEPMESRASRFRAEYMYEHDVFSHYDLEGRHPVYYWTKLDGGLYWFEENLGYTMCVGGFCIDPMKQALDHVYAMVYQDDDSSWGHRDSLLDPCNNYASVAVAYDDRRFYLVIHMISRWIAWIEPPSYNGVVFRAKGVVVNFNLKPESSRGYTFYQVIIYRDSPRAENVRKRAYDLGDPYAGVLPVGYPGYYVEVKTIRARKMYAREEGGVWLFEVEFEFSPEEPGLYTIVMLARNELDIRWTPMSPQGGDRLRWCRLMAYTVEKRG